MVPGCSPARRSHRQSQHFTSILQHYSIYLAPSVTSGTGPAAYNCILSSKALLRQGAAQYPCRSSVALTGKA